MPKATTPPFAAPRTNRWSPEGSRPRYFGRPLAFELQLHGFINGRAVVTGTPGNLHHHTKRLRRAFTVRFRLRLRLPGRGDEIDRRQHDSIPLRHSLSPFK